MATRSMGSIGSAAWQADDGASRSHDRAHYLDTVSASDLMLQVAQRSVDLMQLQPGSRVLEVGCGNGVLLPRLSQAVGDAGVVTGIDHSADLVALARERVRTEALSNVQVDVADAYSLPYPDASFDAAHCERVLMHLDDPGRALAEMARVVRPGGWVVATEPDWAGFRIDHEDAEAMQAAYRAALRQRHQDMGLTLHRRMHDAGLASLRHVPVLGVIQDYKGWEMYGLDLETGIRKLQDAGTFAGGRLQALLPWLRKASEEGRFYSIAVMHVAAGQVTAAA